MSKEEKKMTRRYVRMTREQYEEQMRNTELYFLGEASENECCPTCGEHGFFSWDDLGGDEVGRRCGVLVRYGMTGRELLDLAASGPLFGSYENEHCACCNTMVYVDPLQNRITHHPGYVYYTREQFQEALNAVHNGDMDAYIRSVRSSRITELNSVYQYLLEHFPEQSCAAE